MSILTPDERRARAKADALLQREYEALKPEVTRTVASKLAASGARLPEADIDAVYNLAWHALHTKLAAGEEIANRTGLLVSIAHRRALDEHRASHPSRRADAEQLDELPREDPVAERLDDVTQLRQFVASLRERLDRRELEAAALCYVYDYTRPEAARAIGVAPKRMEKIMDAVSKKVSPLVGEIRAGAWCEQHRSLMTAYALELLAPDGERYRLAREHLDGCSACRRAVLRTRGIAAVAPPLPLLAMAGGIVGVAGAGAAATAGGGAGGSGGAGAAAGGHGAGGGASHGLGTRAKAALATVVVVAAAIAAALALGLGGSDDEPAKAPAAPARTTTPQQLARARAERAARARARARAEAQARARREAARRRARREAAAAAAAARTAAAPPAQEPAAPPPVSEPEPPPPPPAATPEPPPAAAPEPQREPPTRDGAEEFDLR